MSAALTRHRAIYIPVFIVVFCTTIWTTYHLISGRYNIYPIGGSESRHYHLQPVEVLQPQPWEKLHDSHPAIDIVIPPNAKIIGLVFFGRRRLVRILDCYLQVCPSTLTIRPLSKRAFQRNLRDNGGLLDQVIFAVNTNNQDDLAYLDDLVALNPHYSKYVPDKLHKKYVGQWAAVSEAESIYVKIDDDVVSPSSTSNHLMQG